MIGITDRELERLKARYPKGTKLEIVAMEDPYGVPEGTIGEVDFIDDAGQIHMKWQTGSHLALIPGVDSFRKV